MTGYELLALSPTRGPGFLIKSTSHRCSRLIFRSSLLSFHQNGLLSLNGIQFILRHVNSHLGTMDHMPVSPTDISLRCGRVPSMLQDGSDVWFPGFHQYEAIVQNADYVEEEQAIFLSRQDIGARKSVAVSLFFSSDVRLPKQAD